jgi:hypothetical protein
MGGDSFVYQVCDTGGLCDTANVSVTVNPANQSPLAADDYASAYYDTLVIVDVLANDTDPNNNLDPSSVSVTAGPASGSITNINAATGAITYLSNAGFVGDDTFSYQICDTGVPVFCVTASVRVTVSPQIPPARLNIGPPDDTIYNLSCGSSIVLDLGAGGAINLPHPGFDLAFYEFLNGPNVHFDWVVVQVGLDPFGLSWIDALVWGDGGPDAHTSVGQAGLSVNEFDNETFPGLAPQFIGPPPNPARPSELSGVGIDLDLLGVAPGTYRWVRIVAPPSCPNDASEIDAIYVLP